MTKMAASMRPQMEAMRASGGAAAPSGGGGGGGGGSSGAAAAAGGLPDMANMDLDKGLDMMKNMNPDMMKAGIDMMKNMDPAMMKSMSKMMGREVDEKQLEQMQKMMSDMKPEALQKWAGRAQTVAGAAKKPLAAYRACKAYAAKIGTLGALGILGGLLALP